ncbi:hypothetical protein [Mesorhizobium sp.]|uniref:hypothetical protein n=1 Tax=Mesorhizobium sp. TaxID=1871066 RepID=UPI003BAD7ADB
METRPHLEIITIPPDGKPLVRCQNFPECMCGDDCNDAVPADPAIVRRVLFGLLIATAIIDGVLLYLGLPVEIE